MARPALELAGSLDELNDLLYNISFPFSLDRNTTDKERTMPNQYQGSKVRGSNRAFLETATQVVRRANTLACVTTISFGEIVTEKGTPSISFEKEGGHRLIVKVVDYQCRQEIICTTTHFKQAEEALRDAYYGH